MLVVVAQESRVFDDMWEQDRLAKLGREEKEAAARKQMDSNQKAVLDQQAKPAAAAAPNSTSTATLAPGSKSGAVWPSPVGCGWC